MKKGEDEGLKEEIEKLEKKIEENKNLEAIKALIESNPKSSCQLL